MSRCQAPATTVASRGRADPILRVFPRIRGSPSARPRADDSRSELIRRAIDLYLAASSEAVDDLRYAEAYEAIPEDLEELAAIRALAAWPEG